MGSRIFYFLFIFNFPSVIASIKKTGSCREGWNQANITSTFMYNETRHERVGWTSNSAMVPKRKQSKISKSPKNLPACQQYFTSCTPGGVGFGSYCLRAKGIVTSAMAEEYCRLRWLINGMQSMKRGRRKRMQDF